MAKKQIVIKRIVEGEIDLYRSLVGKYNSVLYKIARCYGFNHEDAEDLMQATYISGYTY